MQLVLSGNRIIAHGENFISMGGVVINTETEEKFENATITQCDNCPSDINKVGYEYHAGVFVPCAPYGKGNGKGNFMELSEDCKTPRDSGVSIQDYKDAVEWVTIAEETVNFSGITSSSEHKTIFSNVDPDILSQYTEIAFVAKSGTAFTTDSEQNGSNILVYAGDSSAVLLISLTTGFNITCNEDVVLYTSRIYKKTYSNTSSVNSTNTIKTIVYMAHTNGQPALRFSSVFDSRINGTFVLKARGKVDQIIG